MKSFSELAGWGKFIEVLRWLLVPVAAMLCVLALHFVVRIIVPPMTVRPPGVPASAPSNLRLLLGPLVDVLTAMLFVIAGTMMAPRFRPTTAIVLAIGWIGLSFARHIAAQPSFGVANYADFAVDSVGAVIVAAYVYWAQRSRVASRSHQPAKPATPGV